MMRLAELMGGEAVGLNLSGRPFYHSYEWFTRFRGPTFSE